MPSDKEETEPRYYGLELGTVANVDDPLGLGRVRVIVPGILDQPSPWAPPLGGGASGSPQRGKFAVPPKGSDVGVFFRRGDPTQPYYVGGHFGKTPSGGDEVPTDVKAAPIEERPEIVSEETKSWVFTFDDRAKESKAQIRHKVLNLVIDIDATKGAITIQAESAMTLKCGGMLTLDAPQIQIGDRTVTKNGKPIS